MRRSSLPRGSETADISNDPADGTAPPQLSAGRGVVLAHHLIDASILGLLFLAPLVLGGRHPWGELALIVAALPGTIGLAIKVLAGRRLPLAYWQVGLLAACFLLPLGQTLAVSPDWVRWASPGIAQLFGETPQLTTSERLYQTFSVSAATTEKSLPIIMAYLCVFTLLMVRLESIADVERLLMMLVAATLLLTVLALLQANFGNGRFLWWYDHPSKSPENIPRGPFQNENHLASLLATALPCMLYFLFRESKRRSNYRRWLAAVTCMLVVITVYSTPSRGGAAIIAFAAAVWGSFVGWTWLRRNYFRQVQQGTWLRLGAALGTTVTLIGVAVMYSVVEHYSYWRAKLWQADLAAWRDFPVLGVGVGNHRYIYRGYLDEYWYQTFSVAESSWVQLLVETGAVGVSLALIAVVLLAATLLHTMTRLQNRTQLFLCGALGAGLAASCVHACGDFPWHVPACFVVVLVLVACVCRLPGLSAAGGTVDGGLSPKRLSPNVSMLLAMGLLIGNVWAIRAAVPEVRAARSWDAYRRLVRDQPELRVADGNDPATQLLKQTLREDPYHVLARVKLAGRMAAEFEAKRFQLDDPQQQANTILRHTLVLAAVCPTESRTYLYAALSSSALGASVDKQQLLLAQSQRLRLVDGRVAMRQGLNAVMLQDEATANEQFAIALNDDPSFRESAVQTLRMLYSAQEIVERWQPSRDTSALIYRSCRTHPTSPEQVLVGRHYCECLLADAAGCDNQLDADQLLAMAADVAAEIGDHALSLRLAQRRWELDPRNVNRLLARAKAYHQLGQAEKAREDIARCLQLSPHDQDTRRFALQLDHQLKAIKR